jgi:hypothetical protein
MYTMLLKLGRQEILQPIYLRGIMIAKILMLGERIPRVATETMYCDYA